MLGSPHDADDALQDVWLRWQLTDQAYVANPEAWLVTVTTRLCIDRLRTARRRRSRYTGPWLPEPLVAAIPGETPVAEPVSGEPGPDEVLERAEEVGYGYSLLLERLGPIERAVLLLRDVCGYGYDEISVAVDRSEAACRQLLSRARRKLAHEPIAVSGDTPDFEAVGAFLLALATGDVDAALVALTPDVVLLSDGGARRHAARRPVVGPARVARFLLNLARRQHPGTSVIQIVADGAPGFLILGAAGEPVVAGWFETFDGGIRRAYLLVEPSKLSRLAASVSATSVSATEPLPSR